MMENLLDIKDIHIPEGVSIFPLAKGWWMLIVFGIALIVFINVFFKILKTSKRHYALRKLKAIDTTNPVEAGCKISELLKRICNVKYKGASVLFGKEWLEFLNKHSKKNLTKEASDLLIYAPFIDKNEKKYTSKDADVLKEFCRDWIGDNL